MLQFAFSRLGPAFPRFFGNRAYDLWFTTHRFKRPAAENIAAENSDRSAININGEDVAVWSWGDGQPILFIHGWNGRGTQAAHFVEPLIQSGYRIISFDAPAHGETPGKQTNMLEIASVVQTLGEKFGPFRSTITHSFGGMILAYAGNQGFNTGSAACICPPATLQSILDHFQESLHIPDIVLNAMKEKFYRNYGTDFDRRASTLENVQRLSFPALIIHDDRDMDIDWEEGKAVADAWPGAEFILTHGLGHRRILRDHATITAVTEFIRNA